MAVVGTFNTSCPSGPGWWNECTLTAVCAVTGTTTSAAFSIVYNNTSGRFFQPSLPVGVIILNPATATSAAGSAYSTLQNGTNNVLAQQSTNTGGIGVASVILGTTAQQTNTSTGLISYSETGTMSITFVNAGASATMSIGTRLLFFQSQGN